MFKLVNIRLDMTMVSTERFPGPQSRVIGGMWNDRWVGCYFCERFLAIAASGASASCQGINDRCSRGAVRPWETDSCALEDGITNESH